MTDTAVDRYTDKLRQTFVLGEQHARAIVLDQLAVPGENSNGRAYDALLDAVLHLFPKDKEPPFDAGYAAGLAVGLQLARRS